MSRRDECIQPLVEAEPAGRVGRANTAQHSQAEAMGQ